METTENRVSVKIYESTRDQLEGLKIAARKSGQRLDYADLIQNFMGEAPTLPKPAPKFAEFHGMLDAVLASGDTEQITIIKHQLQACFRQVSASAPAAKVKKAG